MVWRVAAAIGRRLEKCLAAGAEEAEIIQFGVSQLLYQTVHIVTTLSIGLLLRRPLEALAFLGTFSSIRSYAGGYHSKTPTGCYALSSLVSLLYLLAVRFTPRRLKLLLTILSLPLSLSVIWRLSPVENGNHRLDIKERQTYRSRARWIGVGFTLAAVLLTAVGLVQWGFIAAASLLLAAATAVAGEIKNKKWPLS